LPSFHAAGAPLGQKSGAESAVGRPSTPAPTSTQSPKIAKRRRPLGLWLSSAGLKGSFCALLGEAA
jgi:hypothetical protein